MADVVLPNVDASQISKGFSNSMNVIGFWFVIVVFILLTILIIFLIKWYFSYNVYLNITEKRGKTILNYARRGKLVYNKKSDKNNPVQRLVIFGFKKHIMFPVYTKDDNNDLTISEATKKNGKPLDHNKQVPLKLGEDVDPMHLYDNIFGTTDKGKYSMRMIREGDEWTVIPQLDEEVRDYLRVSKPVRNQWANNLIREGLELFAPKQGFMEKYGSLMMMAGTFIVIAIIFIFLFNKLDALKDYSAAINNYAGALTEFTKALREVNVQPV